MHRTPALVFGLLGVAALVALNLAAYGRTVVLEPTTNPRHASPPHHALLRSLLWRDGTYRETQQPVAPSAGTFPFATAGSGGTEPLLLGGALGLGGGDPTPAAVPPDAVVPGDAQSALSAESKAESEPVFRTRPLPVIVVGEPYSYTPETRVPLGEFTLRNAPPGLSVDRASGQITGVPTRAGVFKDVELTGRFVSADSSASQQFRLWVDSDWRALGVTGNGYDIMSSLRAAARITVVPALIAVLVGVGLGTLMGALAGFYGGLTRQLLQGVTTAVQSIPGLLLVYLAADLAHFDLTITMLAIGVIMLPETANGVRELVERFRSRDFVDAARELGMRDRQILWNEIVWHNGRAFLVSRATQGFSFAILLEVTLRFIGQGDPNSTSLGSLLLQWRSEDQLTIIVPALGMLLFIIGTFALLERGLLSLWDRQR